MSQSEESIPSASAVEQERAESQGPRFSLLTLMLVMMLIGSGGLLYTSRAPWQRIAELNADINDLECLAFSDDGRYLATGSSNCVLFWNVSRGAVERAIAAQTDSVKTARFSHNSYRLLIESATHRWSVFDIDYYSRTILLESERGDFKKACFIYDPPDIMVLGKNGYGAGLVYKKYDGTRMSAGDVSPDGLLIAGAFEDQTLRVWNWKTNQELASAKTDGVIDCLEFAPGHNRFLTSSSAAKKVQLWETATGKILLTLDDPVRDRPEFSRDGKSFFMTRAISENTTVTIWNTEDGSRIGACDLPGYLSTIEMTLDGDRLIYATKNSIQICDSNSGRVIATMPDYYTMQDANPGQARANWPAPAVSVDGKIAAARYETGSIWQRRRPEQWWGLAWLPEFWLTVVFAAGFIWSLRRGYLVKD
jgi:WD40 repeat protein